MSKAIQFKNKAGEKIYPCPYYPVGSIYLSVNNTNPGTIFGGTWEQLKDRFLLGAGNTYSNGATGGSINHNHSTGDYTLQQRNMPERVMTRIQVSGKYGCGCNSAVSGWANICLADAGVENNKPHNHGNTGTSNNMPPYLVVYMWKRVK